MKTTITHLSFFFLIVTQIGYSQITVNSSDFFDVGDSYTTIGSNYLTSNSPPGANMTWNYSSLDTLRYRDNTNYILPSSVAIDSNFPTSNIVEFSPVDTGYAYYKKTAGKLEITGTYYSGIILKYSNPRTEYNFPINYNNTLYDESKSQYSVKGNVVGSTADSVRLTINEQKKYKVDSWGTLTLPTGSFKALRVKDTMIFYYTYEEYNSGMWTTVSLFNETSYSNVFVSNNPSVKKEILVQTLDANGNVTDNYWNDVAFGYVYLEENKDELSVELFPNPAINFLNISAKSDFDEMIITDITGKIVLYKKELKITKIDISILNKGSYLLTLLNKEERISKKIVKH